MNFNFEKELDAYTTRRIQEIQQKCFDPDRFAKLTQIEDKDQLRKEAGEIKAELRKGIREIKLLPASENMKLYRRKCCELFEVVIGILELYEMGLAALADFRKNDLEKKVREFYNSAPKYTNKT